MKSRNDEPSKNNNISKIVDSCFKKIILLNSTGRHLIRCELCYKNPKIVLMHTKLSNKIPSICCEYGTIPRASVMESHLKSNSKSVIVERLNTLTSVELSQQAPSNIHCQKSCVVIHCLAKVLQGDEHVKLLFLGFYEPNIGGVNGFYTAIQKSIERIILLHEFFQLLLSIIIDDASINTGNNNGLWR